MSSLALQNQNSQQGRRCLSPRTKLRVLRFASQTSMCVNHLGSSSNADSGSVGLGWGPAVGNPMMYVGSDDAGSRGFAGRLGKED